MIPRCGCWPAFFWPASRQDRNEHRYQALLRSANQDLLWSLGVGFWTLQVWKTEQRREMIADDFMRRQLGIRETAGLEACSTYWYNGIAEEDRGRVEDALREMEETGKTVQTEFAWNHPQRGRTPCAFPGAAGEDKNVLYAQGVLPDSGFVLSRRKKRGCDICRYMNIKNKRTRLPTAPSCFVL